MDSNPPIPVAVSFDDEVITEPERVAPAVAPATEMRAGPVSRLVAWAVDAAFLGAFVAGQMGVAARLFPGAYFLEEARLWGALAACLAVAYSWIFVALGARTPGMALARQHLQTLQGDPPGPRLALIRALLSLVSAGLGLFGFVLALFDARGQALHDKLCRCVVVVSPPDA